MAVSRRLIATMTVWLAALTATMGQPQSSVVVYDEEDGVPSSHVTQLLQDQHGFMWFGTWNGLCRFDGYEFQTFKSQVGDGCHMTTDRFRDIALRPDGNIICRVDEAYYLFDTRTYQFSNLNADENRQAADDIKRYRQSTAIKDGHGQTTFSYTDRQGNRWTTIPGGISKETTPIQHTQRLPIEPRAEVKCLFTDRQQRYWVTTKDDGAVRIYNATDDRLAGYLGADGRLHAAYTRFGAAVYCLFQTADGDIWMGTKPDGLYRLRETSAGTFHIDHFTQLPNNSVYHIVQDRQGRLWIATLGGGLCYTAEPQADKPRFLVPRHYPKDDGQRVRFLHLTADGQVMLGATTDGLLVSRLEADANNMRFRLHRRQSTRAESLSSSATMDIVSNRHGQLFVSTESGGINRIESATLTDSCLAFAHYTADNHQLPSDVVLSLTAVDDNRLMVVSSHLISMIDSVGSPQVFDAHFFNEDYRFNEAHPQQLNDGRWLFGLQDGAFTVTPEQMKHKSYRPAVVVTAVSIQGGAELRAVASRDTLTLQPGERSITIHFAALDFSAPERISYAFRLLSGEEWADDASSSKPENYIGHNRSATLLDLQPGTYLLEIRSTNANGEWLDNVRRLTIIVRPTFWEAWYGQLLILLLIASGLAAILYTLLYIRRIKRKQRETLEKYLALIADQQLSQHHTIEEKTANSQDPMLQRVMLWVEENIANSDASVGDMAAAAATSRSGLQRKLRQAMGITPQDLLREARIKRASQLLHQTDKTVSEVAYACGFTDPKYFSRSFKQSTGKSPTEWKNASE